MIDLDLGNEFKKAVDESFDMATAQISELVDYKTPVDTGDLKATHKYKKTSRYVFNITNNLDYSHKIMIDGWIAPGIGSRQLPDGILPVLEKFKKDNEL